MKKCNKKGMTLVEVIISMAILGAIAGMFVTIAVAAKNQNKDNYQRQREMYSQAAAAESFDTNVNISNARVVRLDESINLHAKSLKSSGKIMSCTSGTVDQAV